MVGRLCWDWGCPRRGLAKGLWLTHPRSYATCPNKAAPPCGGRGQSPRVVPSIGFEV